jgi:hypothetical protein
MQFVVLHFAFYVLPVQSQLLLLPGMKYQHTKQSLQFGLQFPRLSWSKFASGTAL